VQTHVKVRLFLYTLWNNMAEGAIIPFIPNADTRWRFDLCLTVQHLFYVYIHAHVLRNYDRK